MTDAILRPTVETFSAMPTVEQVSTLQGLSAGERSVLLRALSPDDAADVIQQFAPGEQESLLDLLEGNSRLEVASLLAYAQDVAGGLMNPRYLRVRPDMTVQQAITYVRLQGKARRSSYVYVLDEQQKLCGVLSINELFFARSTATVREIMRRGGLVTVDEGTDQEVVAKAFQDHALVAIPVVDSDGAMKGVVTADDIVEVISHEATEDIQKLGGTEALDIPYLTARLSTMVHKRAYWLVTLFLGELLTASAMSYFESQLAKAIVLTLFIPLIVSSGGNAGSQASTLVIRAMALGEVQLGDWWKVMRREFATGLILGLILAAVGLVRILGWQFAFSSYGEHYFLIALTVSFSLVGVVLWGSLIGSILPFVLRRLGFDPASASVPFVATLVDVTGIVIYFTVAGLVLKGTLL